MSKNPLDITVERFKQELAEMAARGAHPATPVVKAVTTAVAPPLPEVESVVPVVEISEAEVEAVVPVVEISEAIAVVAPIENAIMGVIAGDDDENLEEEPEITTGSLKVQVTVAERSFPVDNSFVTIAQNEIGDRDYKILYTLTTNEDGIIDNIVLPAPPKDLSLHAGELMPFSNYRVTVTHPNFDKQVFHNVAIFNDIKSLLRVNMVPSATTLDD